MNIDCNPSPRDIRSAVFILVVFVLPEVSFSAGAPGLQASDGTLNQSVSVIGRIELAGKNYFLDPRFVIVDDQGNFFPVTSWAPLELSPRRPGTPPPAAPLSSEAPRAIGSPTTRP